MPDSLPMHGDTIIIDMIRKFSQERLAPLAAEREKAGRIEPEVIRELGELGVFGATTPTEWEVRRLACDFPSLRAVCTSRLGGHRPLGWGSGT